MQVRDVMTESIECIGPKASIETAAQHMRNLDIGAMPVCEDDRLLGVITDRDIAVRSAAEGHSPTTDRVGDVMTPGVFYCFEDQDVSDAAELMRAKQVRRLVVLDGNKRLAGIVSLGDLALGTGDEQLAGHALEGVCEAALPS